MPYEKQNFVDGQILKAEHLNFMEDGISQVYRDVEDLKYVAIQITSFVNNVGTVEIGSVVNKVILSWVLNKTAKTIELDDEEQSTDITTLTLSDLELTTNKKWTLKVTDERDASATKSTSISFLNGIYYGVAESVDDYDSDFILRLSKTLSGSRAKTFTVTAGQNQHIYYCVPTRFGNCSFNVGGFDGGFDKVVTFDFTNASGYTESYDIYKSTNANLGTTTVKVS